MKRIIDAPGYAPTLFPAQQLGSFVTYIREVWEGLKLQKPHWWNANRETILVDAFYKMLNSDGSRVAHGIEFGHFFLEASEVIIDQKTQMPRRIGRTDISFAYASSMGPILTLEFKRLNNGSSLRRKYFVDGVSRFVSGKYAPAHDTALMVGMIEGSSPLEKKALLRYLARSQARVVLKLAGMPPTYGQPSANAPSVDFDTLHDREIICSAPKIRIGHMLLER